MGRFVFKLPDVGEGTAEAELVGWHVKVGDIVAEDQIVADVMTDKATVELTSPVAGKVTALHGEVGGMLIVRAPLVEFDERPPDATVRLPVEVLLGQDVAGALEGLVVEQDPAEHGLLGLDALRRDPETSDNVLAHVRTSFREHARPGQRH